jgi:hypothetical protein
MFSIFYLAFYSWLGDRSDIEDYFHHYRNFTKFLDKHRLLAFMSLCKHSEALKFERPVDL